MAKELDRFTQALALRILDQLSPSTLSRVGLNNAALSLIPQQRSSLIAETEGVRARTAGTRATIARTEQLTPLDVRFQRVQNLQQEASLPGQVEQSRLATLTSKEALRSNLQRRHQVQESFISSQKRSDLGAKVLELGIAAEPLRKDLLSAELFNLLLPGNTTFTKEGSVTNPNLINMLRRDIPRLQGAGRQLAAEKQIGTNASADAQALRQALLEALKQSNQR